MIGGSLISGDSVGSFTNNYQFANSASCNWVVDLPTITVLGDTSSIDWIGTSPILRVLNDVATSRVNITDPNRVMFVIDSAVSQWVAGDGVGTGVGTVNVIANDSAVAQWIVGDIEVLVVVDPSTGQWIAGDATGVGTGTVSVSAVDSAIAQWVIANANVDYDVSVQGIPDIIVNRSGSTVTIKIRNINDREVTIYKAEGSKATYNTLAKVTSSPYEETEVTGQPKYKAAFTFSGSIGGTGITEKGIDSRSRYTKE